MEISIVQAILIALWSGFCLAGMLLDFGVETDVLFAHLYMRTFDELKFKAHV